MAGAVSLGFGGLHTLLSATARSRSGEDSRGPGFGPLVPDPAGLLDLPAGFSYRVISRVGEVMDDGFRVPGDPDGMAAFPGPNGRTILICNHELEAGEEAASAFGPGFALLENLGPEQVYDLGRRTAPGLGGTTTIVYDTRRQRVERRYLSLCGTINNCAGGPTPWNSWISCEEDVTRAGDKYERDHGYCFDVPAREQIGLTRPVPLKGLGRFRHEAVAVDPATGIVYQTEDRDEGLIYRFIPERKGELAAGGRLQVLCIRERRGFDTRNWEEPAATRPARSMGVRPGTAFDVAWMDAQEIDNPKDDLRFREHERGAACFARGEGMWLGHGGVYFACTNGGARKLGQIWKYTPGAEEGTADEERRPGRLELFIESDDPGLLENADNLTVAPWGDLVVCEDNENVQHLVGITPRGELYRIGRNAKGKSELAGSVFSPDGTTLFVNLHAYGLTLAITGPWNTRV